MFAQWRKLRDQIKKETNYDGERDQCIAMLCKYGGFKEAKKLHPDMVNRQNYTEEEKLERINMFTFLNNCKAKFPDLVDMDISAECEKRAGPPTTVPDSAESKQSPPIGVVGTLE